MFFAFYGPRLNDKIALWRGTRRTDFHLDLWSKFRQASTRPKPPSARTSVGVREGITVLDISRDATSTGRNWDIGLAAS